MKISKRHKRSHLRTKVLRRIEEISPQEWNAIFPDVLEGYNFFKTLDESNLDQFSFYYILVYDRKTLVGATSCFIVNYSFDTSINGPMRHISNSIKKVFPNIFSIRALACGVPMGPGRLGLSGDADRIVKAMLRQMERIARKEKISILAFKDFDSYHTKFLDPLVKEGFTRMDSLPSTEMEIDFKDFEEYMKTLSGATRYDLRRKFKKVDRSVKIDMEIFDSVDGKILEEIYGLYLQVLNAHEQSFEVTPKEFFRNIGKNMIGQTKFFTWRIEGKMVAFVFCMVSKDFLIDYYLGLDYEYAHKYHLYFIKFRDVMNWCFKNGIKKYEKGTSGYDPKKRLGFDLTPLHIYAMHRNRFIRPVFKRAIQLLKFENFDPVLKEFKYKSDEK
jgi:predicted N-acyltransferase